MGRIEGRSAGDTKRLILDATARTVRRDGLSATLDSVAAEAGVSKGGLLYHYASKAALLQAAATDLFESFRAAVFAAVDDADTEPGRLTRAYIRVSFDDADDVSTMRDNVALAAHLMSEVDLEALAIADAERWRTDLADDGLPAATVRLVVTASDGASIGPLWGSVLHPGDMDLLREQLLDLTRTAEPAT